METEEDEAKKKRADKYLSFFIDLNSLSGRELEEDNDDISTISELLKRLQLRRARVEL